MKKLNALQKMLLKQAWALWSHRLSGPFQTLALAALVSLGVISPTVLCDQASKEYENTMGLLNEMRNFGLEMSQPGRVSETPGRTAPGPLPLE